MIFGLGLAHAQTTEFFSTEVTDETTFTHETQMFSTTLHMEINEGAGYGHGGDDKYLGTGSSPMGGAGIAGSITNNTTDFYVHSLWIYPSSSLGAFPSDDGTVIFRGKLNGATVFTQTVNSGFSTNYADVNQGFSLVNFTSYNSTSIDELEIEVTGSFNYIAIDDFKHEMVPSLISQTIMFSSFSPVTYGDADFAPGASATSGLTIAYSSSDENIATIVSGQVHIVAAGSCFIHADQAGDDTYETASRVSQALTVGKKTLTATAETKSKTYGDANPALTVAYTGFVGSDDQDVIDTPPTASTTATSLSGAGGYTITLTGGTDNNYMLSNNNGTFTVNKATLTATAENKMKKSGEINPDFTILFTGYVNGDTKTDIDVLPTGYCSADQSSMVGDYPITVSGGLDNNYDFSYQAGNLEIQLTTSYRSNYSIRSKISPNPTKGLLVVSDNLANKTFAIYSLSGSLAMKGKVNNTTVDISELNDGIYILIIGDSKFRVVKI